MYIYAVLIICHIIQFSHFFEEATIVSSFSLTLQETDAHKG